MKNTYKFSIYNGQHKFQLVGKKIYGLIAYKLYEIFTDGSKELVDHVYGYTKDKETFFEEEYNLLVGYTPNADPVGAVKQILTQIY